mmetsp:Transcript_3777/g.12604  ORF Transcript_3777/g.12604 Transcript_3777/m.12604 type:complete len:363 (+) Transcript_3777:759-1847(+)
MAHLRAEQRERLLEAPGRQGHGLPAGAAAQEEGGRARETGPRARRRRGGRQRRAAAHGGQRHVGQPHRRGAALRAAAERRLPEVPVRRRRRHPCGPRRGRRLWHRVRAHGRRGGGARRDERRLAPAQAGPGALPLPAAPGALRVRPQGLRGQEEEAGELQHLQAWPIPQGVLGVNHRARGAHPPAHLVLRRPEPLRRVPVQRDALSPGHLHRPRPLGLGERRASLLGAPRAPSRHRAALAAVHRVPRADPRGGRGRGARVPAPPRQAERDPARPALALRPRPLGPGLLHAPRADGDAHLRGLRHRHRGDLRAGDARRAGAHRGLHGGGLHGVRGLRPPHALPRLLPPRGGPEDWPQEGLRGG